MIVFETADAAQSAGKRIRSVAPPEGVTIESTEVREVVANA
jgi:hypothetical protein